MKITVGDKVFTPLASNWKLKGADASKVLGRGGCRIFGCSYDPSLESKLSEGTVLSFKDEELNLMGKMKILANDGKRFIARTIGRVTKIKKESQ